ncbi:MAG: hypothetical protein VX294_06560 [Candidatus Latescibacterota bacterium]|nr:hypothetical protein [Candidatus Latescibacterota bacterium]
MIRLCRFFFVTILISGCATVSENTVVPVMGVAEKEEGVENEKTENLSVVHGSESVLGKNIDPLAQSVLFLPFEDKSNYKGEWFVSVDLASGLADSLANGESLVSIPVEKSLELLDKKELKGRITEERALEIGRKFGVDYVVLGVIDELSMKRFRATVPVGGYRSYQGITSVRLFPYRVIDGQSAGEVTREATEDSKRYGITNPAAFVPLEKEYFLLGQMDWGSSEFHNTLLGKSVGKNFVKLVAGLDSLIRPRSNLKVASGPKIIDVDGERAYINVGLADSVANGNKYGVWDQGRQLKDPSTGNVLGSALPRRVGVVQVEQVLSEHLSLVRILEGQEELKKDYDIRAE